MAKFTKFDGTISSDAGDLSQGQANPWIADRSLGSVRTALQLAESMGHARKVTETRAGLISK